MNRDEKINGNDWVRQNNCDKEGRDLKKLTGLEEEASFRRALVERFLHTYITYHTCYRKLFPEEEAFTRAQMKMLGALRVQGKCSLKKLCAILSISHPNGSIMIEKLVKQGLVCRIPNTVDRRKIFLSLTPEGQKIAEGLWENEVVAYDQHFKIFSKKEMEQLAGALAEVDRLLKKIDLSKEE